mgnify:FL=1
MKAKGVLEHADHFDADFFGISYKDACALNIQARVLLETVWEALEDAGYYPRAIWGVLESSVELRLILPFHQLRQFQFSWGVWA